MEPGKIKMRVVVETPKWSFTKYGYGDGSFHGEFTSPLPALFNYGFVEDTVGADGMGRDAIVLGARVKQGARMDVTELGVVRFTDDGIHDDKTITSADGRITIWDKTKIHAFFSAYMMFKTIHYLLREHRIAKCRYRGFTLSHSAR